MNALARGAQHYSPIIRLALDNMFLAKLIMNGNRSGVVKCPLFLDHLAERWSDLIKGRRETLLLACLLASSLVALLPFAREASMSNFFIYALLPIILVFANRARFESVPAPSGTGLALSVLLIIGSFIFNSATGVFTGDFSFGLTDYIILVVGVYAGFYSIFHRLTQLGMVVLVALRGVTLALSIAYSSAFVSVSSFIVSIVVFFSKIFVSPEVISGTVAGEILVGGRAGNTPVVIGWGCAGLEELALITAILFILIYSFDLSSRRLVLWLSLGVVGSFLVNIARMVILIWIARSRGIDDMLWAHTHLGDVLFLVWIGVFWLVFFKLVNTSTAGKPNGTG
jgi:exosortase/archaeosortase family protein